MTLNGHHIHIVGRQGQHISLVSDSHGQSQGHKGHFRFLPFLHIHLGQTFKWVLGILDCGTYRC